MKNFFAPTILWFSAAIAAIAQTAERVSVPPANVPLRPVVSAAISGQPTAPVYEISLKWNERDTAVLTAPFKNTGSKAMKVLGVQATRGVFVGDFPSTIPAGKEDNISFLYSAADNTDGDVDIIRLLTDQGIREIYLRVVRDDAVNLDTTELRWTVGEAPVAKNARLVVRANTVAPQRVRVTGGHSATLEKVSDTVWNVRVTPSSTAKSDRFAVFLDFDKALPGRAAVVLGVIQPKE
jgi:hypothetical protein